MAADAKDFDIKFSLYNTANDVATNIAYNASHGTSYYNQWMTCEVRQQMSANATFSIRLGGVASSSIPVAVNMMMGVYYNDGSTTSLVFIGMVSNVTYENYNYLDIEGQDMSYLLSNQKLDPTTSWFVFNDGKYVTPDGATLNDLINILNASETGAAILPVETIVSLPVKMEIPLSNKRDALWYVASQLKTSSGGDIYFYINELTGGLNAKSTRGASTAVAVGGQDGYYLTGEKQNAYAGKRHLTGLDIYNDITVVGHSGKVMATYSDYTTKETTLTSGDKHLIAPFNIVDGTCDTVMYLYDIEGLPSSGYILLRDGGVYTETQPSTNWFSPMTLIAYTGASGNSLSGCTVATVGGTPAFSPLYAENSVWTKNSPAFVAGRIYVASTTDFASSGELQIGDEVITYTGKNASAAYFSLDVSTAAVCYTRFAYSSTTLSADIDADDDTITVASTSGMEAKGVIRIYGGTYPSEDISYTSIDGTHFSGCMRGDRAGAHSSGDGVVQIMLPEYHPSGVFVKQGTNGAVDATSSSIKVNGIHSLVVQEPNIISKKQVELYASKLLGNYRWGGIYHELFPQDVGGDFNILSIGDKVAITDSSLGLSASEVRVMSMRLVLNRESAYELALACMPYATAFTRFDMKSVSLKETLKMSRESRWL